MTIPEIAEEEKRCACGQLLAILSEQGIELKCKRCKRLHMVTAENLVSFFNLVRNSKSNGTKDREPLSSDPSLALARASSPCQCNRRKEIEK